MNGSQTRRWGGLAGCFALVAAGEASAVPIDQTPYGRSTLRLEWRPGPQEMRDSARRQEIERGFAEGGVGARWISVVDPLGSPVYDSAALPTEDPKAVENEAVLNQWVEELHARGLPVLSWYPLIITQSGWAKHPDWRQAFIVPQPEGRHKDIDCCIHSGYGQALIDFCNEAIDRFKLDGIWFDGSAWTQIWDRPVPLSCVCGACRRQFEEDTGADLPTEVNWGDPTFRHWVAWRYEAFGRYLGRLAEGIRGAHPEAAVVVNHYHRPVIPWQSAIPLNPYAADIITGSEATGEARVDLTMRLCRAYGRPQSEVWRPFDCAANAESAPQTDELLHHALTCFAAGGMPSFGGGDAQLVGPTARILSPIMKAIRPFVAGASYPYAALHLSQQTETFHLSRDPKGVDWSLEPFWQSIEGWTQGLDAAHVPPDYVYDRDLTAANLRRYRALLLPMSFALSRSQAQALVDFARNGGVVVVGLAAGSLDEWGERQQGSALGEALGYAFDGVPSPAADEWEAVTLQPRGYGDPVSTTALRAPLRLMDRAWKVLYQESTGAPAIARRKFERGHVLVVNTDLGRVDRGWQPVAGGKTRLDVTDEVAASGRHSLQFVDDPDAPYPFCPDMEMHFKSFGPPRSVGGRMTCDVRLGKGSVAAIELRSSVKPCGGAALQLGRHGKLTVGDRELADVPIDTWLHLEVRLRFGAEGAVYDVSLAAPGQTPQVFGGLPAVDQGFSRCDWAVIFGLGTDPATFQVDNVRIERLSADGTAAAVLADDFEATPVGQTVPNNPVPMIARMVQELAPPPLEVEAPGHVRVGMFQRPGGEVLVHLHNLNGSHRGWEQMNGPEVRLRARVPVQSAESALTGRPLVIRREGRTKVIVVPSVGLYEVVRVRLR